MLLVANVDLNVGFKSLFPAWDVFERDCSSLLFLIGQWDYNLLFFFVGFVSLETFSD